MKLVKILLKILILILTFTVSLNVHASGETLEAHEVGTFDEYIFKISNQMFLFQKNYKIKGYMQSADLRKLESLVNDSFKFLPDNNLKNKRLANDILTAIGKGKLYNRDVAIYSEITDTMASYVDDVTIGAVSGRIVTTKKTGASPLTVTLTADVRDPNGLVLPEKNYIWYTKTTTGYKLLGRQRILKHTFNQEGYVDVFLAVKSSHVNSHGNPDVKNFGSKVTLNISEPAVYFNIKVNNDRLLNDSILKFTPAEASRGLVFNATSTIPNRGREFIKTEWDFGNNVEREYDGSPRIETVTYSREGRYRVKLKLKTNEGISVTKDFDIEVRDPIAKISASKTDGYVGDTLTFAGKTVLGENDEDLLYSWKVSELTTDKVIYQGTDTLITHKFKEKGRYNVELFVTGLAGEKDYDNKLIEIYSRAPVAKFEETFPYSHKPNTVYLDGTESHDPDISDRGKLEYIWTIDGVEVELTNPSPDNATGYFTFNSKGNHNVTLEVIDPEGISADVSEKIEIDSVLSVDFSAYPRVVKKGELIALEAISPEAKFYEWDFDDGETDKGMKSKLTHKYDKAGEYEITLKVLNEDNQENQYTKKVYVSPSNSPTSIINVDRGAGRAFEFKPGACSGSGAYIVDRVSQITFDGGESVSSTGANSGVNYSWKINNDYFNSKNVAFKFDELGCFDAKLTVTDEKTRVSHSSSVKVKVENVKPMASSLTIDARNLNSDPVVIDVRANNAKDPDGVIQSYLWYYYTDTEKDPQSFRATSTPNTSFVLPKVTGNYYFVLIMKDSNGGKSTTDSREEDYFITLEGDNINTPIISLSANNTSVQIGDEVVFRVNVKNILGQDLSSRADYFWDFDGDGLYDKETKQPTVAHTFKKSGNFKTKVKVRYKGMSNTKTKSIDVANKLLPDFEYLSFGDKVVLFNTSTGSIDKVKFDLGDGTVKEIAGDTYMHEYKDGEKSHEVKLIIQEGTKVKELTKEVKYNSLNKIRTKKDGIYIYSTSDYDAENGLLTITESGNNPYIYFGESKGDFKYYAVDYNLEEDSNLNGTTDDDIDNKTHLSFKTGAPLQIDIDNDYKEQKVRIFLLAEDGETVVNSSDFTILKEYVEELDVEAFKFDGISEEDKVVIEKIKESIELLPKSHRLEASKYVQKLENAWFDEAEKTQTILDFGNFVLGIDGMDETLKEDFFRNLENLIVKDNEAKSTREISYTIIKNLLPLDLVGYEDAMALLDEIRDTRDLEKNRELGKKFLGYIANATKLTLEDKNNIKEQLKILIYDNEVVEEIETTNGSEVEAPKEKTDIGAVVMSTLKWLAYILIGIFGVLFVGLVFFFILYKLTNKDPHIGFQDFIIEKTYAKEEDVSSDEDLNDVLGYSGDNNKDHTKAEVKKDEPKKEENTVPTWMQSGNTDIRAKVGAPKKDNNANASKPDTPKSEVKAAAPKAESNKEELPDWLKPKNDAPKKEEAKKEESLKGAAPKAEPNKEELPDWLKPKNEAPKKEEAKKEEALKGEAPKAEPNKEELPDWLKPKNDAPKKEEAKKEEALKGEAPKAEPNKEELPDWLKPKKDTPKKEEAKKEESLKGAAPKAEPNKEELPDWLKPKNEAPKKEEAKKEEALKGEAPKAEPNKEELPDWLKPKNEAPKKEEAKKEEALKGEAPKAEPNKEELKVEKESKDDLSVSSDALPDFLKSGEPDAKDDEIVFDAKDEKVEIKDKEEKKGEKPKPKKEEVKKEEPAKAKPPKAELKPEEKAVKEEKKDESKPQKEVKKDEPKEEPKKEEKAKEEDNKSDEDQIPDWLKASIKEKDAKPKSVESKREDASSDEIPDWLKASISPEVLEEANEELAEVDKKIEEKKEEAPKNKRGRPAKKKGESAES